MIPSIKGLAGKVQNKPKKRKHQTYGESTIKMGKPDFTNDYLIFPPGKKHVKNPAYNFRGQLSSHLDNL